MTGEIINANGVPIVVPNDIAVERPGFYVSYNDRDINIYGDVTTALVSETPTKFLILYGNHSKEYGEILAGGGNYDDCVQYFRDNESLKAKHSENWDELLIFKDDRLVIVKDERYKK